ncbi:rubrerythrin-like domain-containing protein [Halorussus litoreus]|nr:rubrerythrin-like domain-containing protein [Halorussus litoreus]
MRQSDPDYDAEAEYEYECTDCATIVSADSHPGDCSDCGAAMRNRRMPFE